MLLVLHIDMRIIVKQMLSTDNHLNWCSISAYDTACLYIRIDILVELNHQILLALFLMA